MATTETAGEISDATKIVENDRGLETRTNGNGIAAGRRTERTANVIENESEIVTEAEGIET